MFLFSILRVFNNVGMELCVLQRILNTHYCQSVGYIRALVTTGYEAKDAFILFSSSCLYIPKTPCKFCTDYHCRNLHFIKFVYYTYYFSHYFLRHFFLIKQTLFLPLLVLFYHVASKFFKCSILNIKQHS